MLAAFATGERPRLIVSGEPGIGKSALLRELRARACGRGLRSVAGVGDELDGGVAHGIFADALDGPLSELDGDDLAALGPARVAELAAVFPTLAGAAPAGASAVGGAALHGALVAALERLAAEPLVLVLDDVQWADDASLSLLARLLRRPPRRVLLVVSHRNGDLPDLLVRAIGLTPGDGELHHLALRPLAPGAAQLLLDGIPAVRGRQIMHESGGNPFYLSELAASERADGAPLTLRAALIAELSALPEEAALLVRAAGVLGDPFDPQLAAAVAGLDRVAAAAALDELVAADVVRTTAEPERCRFRRPVLAAVARHWAGGAWRMAAHARAAELLERTGAPLAARARHVERSARRGDVSAIRLLKEAGGELLDSDPRGAAHWFAAALRLLPAGEQPARRLALLLDQAVALASSGDVESARAPLEEALVLLPQVPCDARAEALVPVARVEAMLAQHPDALALLRDSAAADQPQAHVLSGVAEWFAGDWDAMATSARRALQRAGGEAVALRAQAAALLSVAERQLGHTAAAYAAFAEAEWTVHDAPEQVLPPDALISIAAAAEMLDRHEQSLLTWEHLLEVARTSGQEFFAVPALAGQTVSQLRLGRLRDAERTASEALEAARELPDRQALVLALTGCARVALARGEVEQALAHGEAAVAALEEVPTAVFGELTRCTLAAARLADGDVDRGVDELLTAAGGLTLERLAPTWRTAWAGLLAEAELTRRRPCAARAWSERAAEMAVAVGSVGAFAEAELTRARVLLEDGDWTTAAVAAERACESFEALGRRTDAARAAALRGEAEARLGDAAGVERLRAAYARLIAIGAGSESEAAARALRRLGQRVPSRRRPRRPQRGSAALSAREREIAALVATGATNRQIAERLVISEKTVESHMTRIFTKLGVSSRTAAVHALGSE